MSVPSHHVMKKQESVKIGEIVHGDGNDEEGGGQTLKSVVLPPDSDIVIVIWKQWPCSLPRE